MIIDYENLNGILTIGDLELEVLRGNVTLTNGYVAILEDVIKYLVGKNFSNEHINELVTNGEITSKEMLLKYKSSKRKIKEYTNKFSDLYFRLSINRTDRRVKEGMVSFGSVVELPIQAILKCYSNNSRVRVDKMIIDLKSGKKIKSIDGKNIYVV